MNPHVPVTRPQQLSTHGYTYFIYIPLPSSLIIIIILLLLLLLFCFFRAAPAAYGGSQARGQIGATAASLHHSHSNPGPELYLQPTPQLTAMAEP